MSRQVYAILPYAADEAIQVAVREGREWRIAPASAFSARPGDEITAFAPGTEIASHTVTIPARNEREARRAAPFAIEDELAVPVEGLHIALSAKGEAGSRTVLACDREVMARWVSLLAAAGLNNARIVADFDVLQQAPAIVETGQRYIVHSGAQKFSLDAAMPDELIRATVHALGENVAVYGDGLAQRLGIRATGSVADESLIELAQRAEGATLTDLRQGAFSSRAQNMTLSLAGWKRPLGLAAVAGLGWIGATLLETHSLNTRAEQLRTQAQTLYQARFPEDGRVTNPATRIQQRLSSGETRSLDFQRTAAILFTAVAETDGASVSGLRYDAGQGELRANIDFASYGDDARITDRLEDMGLAVTLGDARSNGRGISGEIRIGGPS